MAKDASEQHTIMNCATGHSQQTDAEQRNVRRLITKGTVSEVQSMQGPITCEDVLSCKGMPSLSICAQQNTQIESAPGMWPLQWQCQPLPKKIPITACLVKDIYREPWPRAHVMHVH